MQKVNFSLDTGLTLLYNVQCSLQEKERPNRAMEIAVDIEN